MPWNKDNILVKYANLATQLLAGIGLTTWLGWWMDKKRNTEKPLFTWLLPLLLVLGSLVKIVKETDKKK